MSPPSRLRQPPVPTASGRADTNGTSDGQTRRYRVLIADDHPEHLDMIARAIQRSSDGAHIDLVRAMDGSEALRRAKEGVDLAFLDIRMPGCSGLEVVQRLRADPAHAALPVVIVSSSSDPRDVASATALGVTDYVEKGRFGPFKERIEHVLAAFINRKPL